VETTCPEYNRTDISVIRHRLDVVVQFCGDMPSGTTAEVRCSLPILILDNCVLVEARIATQMTRSTFLMAAAGISDPSPTYHIDGSSALPRYTDRAVPSGSDELPHYDEGAVETQSTGSREPTGSGSRGDIKVFR